jgi:iduronate 2-sulfatase
VFCPPDARIAGENMRLRCITTTIAASILVGALLDYCAASADVFHVAVASVTPEHPPTAPGSAAISDVAVDLKKEFVVAEKDQQPSHSPQRSSKKKPDSVTNVLFIAIDDLTTTAVHCYGNSQPQTPVLDRFAASAVRFDRAYCQFPLCGPSRCSLMLGLRPDTTRLYGNSMSTPIRHYFPDIVTLPQMFKNNGYFSGRVGKIYHYGVPGQIGTNGIDDPPSWNQVVNPSGRDKDDEHEVIKLIAEHKNLGGTLCWMQARGTDEEQTDGKVAAETIKMLEANKDKPFFIGCGFYRPHVPDVAVKQWFDLYPLQDITLPAEPDHLDAIPRIALNVWPPNFANFGVTPVQLREFKRAYLAATSFVDAQVGKVLDALHRLKLDDKTIVVIWSDHGWCLGEHGQWQKQLLFEESARVVLMIRQPHAEGNGSTCYRTVELLDLFPTLADLCGLTPPSNLEGKTLRPLLDNPKQQWDLPAFTQSTRRNPVGRGNIMGRSIRTEHFRYTEWDSGKQGTELYNEKDDSKEYHNLANDSKYSATIAEMKKRLESAPH